MPEPIPCLLQRKLVPKVWGGRALAAVLGLDLPASEAIGETWEVYDRPDGASAVQDSELTLRDLMQDQPEALLGRGVEPAAGARFPLALKFLDAAQALSVQVHPDDEQAAAEAENDSGKSEAWVVLHAGPNACIRRGFVAGVTNARFAAAASSQGVLELLQTFAPRAGDSVHVPAGTVHSIGPDVVVYEIQQNSDITYRLWDWGRPRATHVQQGLRAARFDLAPATTTAPEPIGRAGAWLVRDPHFRVRRFALAAPATLGTEGTFKLVTLVRGRATLGWRSGGRDAPLRLTPGDTALVPACAGAVFFSPVGPAEILIADPGERG